MAKRDIKSIEPFIFLSKQITILKESPTHFQFIANPYTNPPRKFKYNPLSHNLLLTTHNSSPITRHKHQSHTRPQPTQKRSRLSPTKKVVRYLRRTLRQRARRFHFPGRDLADCHVHCARMKVSRVKFRRRLAYLVRLDVVTPSGVRRAPN